MKKIPILFLLAALAAGLTFALAATLDGQNFTYVGAQKCALCHKADARGAQFKIWQDSRHSKSYEVLLSPKAAESAKSLGIDKPAESPQCVKCHVPLAEKAPEIKAEGVTCEVCHGPGSDYRKLPVMQDRAKAAANGLVLYGSPAAVKAQCSTCHADAHGAKFDFEGSWGKIKHPIPAK